MTGAAGPIVSLADVRDDDAARVGPKAMNLARLLRQGLPVPDGFCVVADACRRHFAAPDIRSCLAALFDRDPSGPPVATLLEELRGAIVATPLADDVKAGVTEAWRRLGGYAIAIRSTATAEDLPGHSFAGLHATFLGLSDLDRILAAVRECWASLWSERTFVYRERNGIGGRDVAMAVLLQRLVPARVAGVAFTADPVSGARDRVIIESSYGLGETVVSGRVTPDRFVLDRNGLEQLERAISDKQVQAVFSTATGVRERPVEHGLATKPSLTKQEAADVARLALNVDRVFGEPHDIEWAMDPDGLFLLQARPITGLPAEKHLEGQVWTNINAADNLPDVMCPLTWSLTQRYVPLLFGALFGRLGLDLRQHPVIGRIAGRLYMNLNTFVGVLRNMPMMRNRKLSEVFGGQGSAAAVDAIEFREDDIPDLGIHPLTSFFSMGGFLFWALGHPPHKGRAYFDRLRISIDAASLENAADLADEDIVPRLDRWMGYLVEMDHGGVNLTTGLGHAAMGMMYWSQLLDLCNKWLDDPQGFIAGRLLAGVGDMDAASAGLEMYGLARHALDNPAVRAALEAPGGWAAARPRLEEMNEAREFLSLWDRFMHDHGHHARGEMDLIHPRWRERPDYVLEAVRGFMRTAGRVDPVAQLENMHAGQAQLMAECRSRLRNPFRRWIFAFVVRQARLGAPLRENLKNQWIRCVAQVRMLVLELGRRLARDGIIERAEDVFFLYLEELEPVRARTQSFDVRAAIAGRRAEYDRNRSLSPPSIVRGDFDPDCGVPPANDNGSRVLEGLAVSAGRVTGPARVILSVDSYEEVKPGEVLVVPFTDPGWSPYFLAAAALVVDTGGLLSHGSIVAREYGLPAVVNTISATRRIRTGDTVTVDGTAGTVTLAD